MSLVLLWMAVSLATPSATVEPLTAPDFAKKVVAPHRGKVLLVNFWATWCEPCVAEMPGLAKAGKQAGVDLVTVSLDSAKNLEPVRSFLFKAGVTGSQFVASMTDPEQFINGIDASWDGTVPYTLVYDSNGMLVGRLRGMQDDAGMQRAIAAAKKTKR